MPTEEGARLAQSLLGAGNLIAASVPEYAITAQITNNAVCWGYRRFKATTVTKPGVVVIAQDGKRCGVVDKEGDKVVHRDPDSGKIILSPLTYLEKYFGKGYTIHDYSC